MLYVPQIILGEIFAGFILVMIFEESNVEKLENFSVDLGGHELTLIISNIVTGLGFTIFSIYLIATWSEKWNEQFTNH